MSEAFEIGCPKCGSTQITANKKGYSAGKALGGAFLTGGIGLLAGFHGSSKVMITCLACGKKFKAGEGKKVYPEKPISLIHQTTHSSTRLDNPNELNRIICSDCKTENFTNHIYCRNCGRELNKDDSRIHSTEILKIFTCPSCKHLTPIDGKFCTHCKTEIRKSINSSNSGCMLIIIVGFIISGIATILIIL